jgi:hypothetical protein
MMSIGQAGDGNEAAEANDTLKFFQRVYRLTPWVVATFEKGRAALPKIGVPFDPADERRLPPTRCAVDLSTAEGLVSMMGWTAHLAAFADALAERVSAGSASAATGRAYSQQTQTAARGAAVC